METKWNKKGTNWRKQLKGNKMKQNGTFGAK